jgi:hypothetical protein
MVTTRARQAWSTLSDEVAEGDALAAQVAADYAAGFWTPQVVVETPATRSAQTVRLLVELVEG